MNTTTPSNTRKIRGRKARLSVAAIASLSLVAAACGDDADDTAATTTPEAPATTEAMAEGSQFGPACSAVPADGEGSFGGMADDPAATAASNNPLLSTLVTAVGAANLVDTLNSEGPFTIFAPTNDAFAAIPPADLDAVLADTDLLTSILTYHVVAGQSLNAAGLAEAGELETVNGGTISFGTDGTTVNDVNVICSDVTVGNGTVHIIDAVLMPMADEAMEEDMTATTMEEMIEEGAMAPTGDACVAVPADGEGSFDGMADDPAATAASNNPVLSTLVAAVTAAGLGDTLNSEGPFTIFAPTNDAFAAIPPADLDAVLADTDLLTSILTYHVIAGESLSSADLAELGTSVTVNGGELEFADDDGVLTVNGVAAGCQDVQVANGTVHIIGEVLMPAADEMMEGAMAPTGDACVAVPTDGEGSFDGMADDPAATAASNNPVLSTLVTAVGAAGLVDTLNSEGPFTIFAPTNDAFAAIPPADLDAVLADTDLLTSILTFHVIAGESLSSADLVELGTATSVNGGELEFTDDNGVLTVNGVAAGCQDVQVGNGTVHIIGEVLMPG